MGIRRRAACALVWVFALGALAACSSKTDGPTPRISAVDPVPICDAQRSITLLITGSGFSPAVVDGLTDTPRVVMPSVVFIGSSGEIEVPAAGVSISMTNGSELVVEVPQNLLPPDTYTVEVTNPNGNAGTSSGFVVHAPPDLVSINPSASPPMKVVDVTLTGTGFQPGMLVTLLATPPVTCANVMVSADGASATCSLDLNGVAPGTYDIVIDNQDGCNDTLPLSFTVGNEFTLLGIDPPFGCTCSDTNVTISSAAKFASTPRIEMRPAGQASPVTLMKRVAFVDASTITAVVPDGLPLGMYDIIVINPPSTGGIGTLPNGFRVVMNPIPRVDEVVPSRGTPQLDTDVTIYGRNFRDPGGASAVKVELLNRNGDVIKTVSPVTPTSTTRIDTTLPTTGMAEDAYLVRVTNLDENTYSTWSAFIVGGSGASGNLHTFTTSPALGTGRRMLGGVSARDDLGNNFIYAIGGDTGSTGTVLDTVEVAQLSKFGALAAWRSIRAPNHLTTPRDAPVAVTVPLYSTDPFIPDKTYVYVSGGRDGSGTVLGSVERAMVLRNKDAPRITSIAASATAGTLGQGTWYYKVSAVLAGGSGGDPDNRGGETLPSDEEILTIQATGAIELQWTSVTVNSIAAAEYRVYRTAMVDGVSQQEKLIATVSGTSYTDTGAAAGADGPLPPGSLGVWTVQTPTHTARWGHTGTVITDGNSARFMYVLGGKSNATTGYLSSVERAPIDTQGQLGTFVTTSATALPTARAFSSLVVETQGNVSTFGGVARMFTFGGVDAGGASDEIVFSDVSNGGGNGAWTVASVANTGTSGQLGSRTGPFTVIASERMFCIGGAGTSMANTTAFSNILNSARDVPFTGAGAIGTPVQATPTPDFTASRALGAAITGSGFIYLVGGTSTGTDAVDTTFQTF